MWHKSCDAPKGSIGKWTRPLVCVTSLGRVFSLSFFVGDGKPLVGYWQRPTELRNDEFVAFWTEFPDL